MSRKVESGYEARRENRDRLPCKQAKSRHGRSRDGCTSPVPGRFSLPSSAPAAFQNCVGERRPDRAETAPEALSPPRTPPSPSRAIRPAGGPPRPICRRRGTGAEVALFEDAGIDLHAVSPSSSTETGSPLSVPGSATATMAPCCAGVTAKLTQLRGRAAKDNS